MKIKMIDEFDNIIYLFLAVLLLIIVVIFCFFRFFP